MQQLQNSNILLQEIDQDVLTCTESVNDLVTIETADLISSECFEDNIISESNIGARNLCEICQLECADQHAMQEHMQSHLGKFLCTSCNLWFLSNSALLEHEKTHSAKESYSCFLCDINLVGVSELKNHLRR